MDPSAMMSGDYRLSNVILKDGQVLAGTIVEKKESTLKLQTTQQQIVIDRSDINQLQPTTLSLMPDGLLNNLAIDDVRDLFVYIMGKNGR